jgi:hypothetical protein
VGFLIGFTPGLAKAGTGFDVEPATSPSCPPPLTEPATAAVEDN